MQGATLIRSSGLLCFAIMGLLALTSPSQAEVYRCINSAGDTTYTQTPCSPYEESEIALVENDPNYRDNDCDVIRSFAWHAADAARRDVDSPSVFKRYGGLHQLPGATVTLVNDVYHSVGMGRSNDQATAVAVHQCKTGNLGSVNCAGLPRRWINALGGCKSASQFKRIQWFGKQRVVRAAPAASATTQPKRRTTSPTLHVIEKREMCRASIKVRIDKIHSQMRMINSPAQQDRLREKRRQLSDALHRC